MKQRLTRAARSVCLSCAAVLVGLLVFATTAGAAPYYFHRPPVTHGASSVPWWLAVLLVLVIAVEVALVVVFSLARGRRVRSNVLEHPRSGSDAGHTQRRRAA